jgi:hypothetical protein
MKPLEKLLVLTDYTVASTLAAAHCVQMALLNKSEVISLHSVSSTEDAEWAEKKSLEQLKQLPNFDPALSIRAMVTTQNLFKELKPWMEQERVSLAFMATHGKKDVQFITGSNALKLLFGAAHPMMIVQHTSPVRPYDHVVLPVLVEYASLLFDEETFTAILGSFRSKLTLLVPVVKDAKERSALAHATERIKQLTTAAVREVEVIQLTENKKKWEIQVLDKANEMKADVVAVITGARQDRAHADKNKKFIQSLITNPTGLPVLCM